MTHRERLQAAALEKWLKLYERQQRCSQCAVVNHQCGKHPRGTDEFNRLAEQTRKLLAGGPN